MAFILLTACWDKVELENRAFVNTVGIDTNEKAFVVTALLPSHNDNSNILTATSAGLYPALQNINLVSSQTAYYGQTKAIILSHSLLKNPDLLAQALDAMERNREVSRKVSLLASEEPAQNVLKAKLAEDQPLGMYISSFYTDKHSELGVAFKKDLEGLLEDLRRGNGAVIPCVKIKDEIAHLSGAALLSPELTLHSLLNSDELRGLMLAKGQADEAGIFARLDGVDVPLRLFKQRSKLNFGEDQSGLWCKINIKAWGSIDEYRLGQNLPHSMEGLQALYARTIKEEIRHTACRLAEARVDGIGLLDHLRKFHYCLYEKYVLQNKINLSDIRIEIAADVVISDIGAIN